MQKILIRRVDFHKKHRFRITNGDDMAETTVAFVAFRPKICYDLTGNKAGLQQVLQRIPGIMQVRFLFWKYKEKGEKKYGSNFEFG